MKILYLTEKQVQKFLLMPKLIPAIQQAFAWYAKKQAQMPPKVYLDLPQFHGDFRAMPAAIYPLGFAGIKWVNVHPENYRRQLPTVMAMMILNNPKTGEPLAVIESSLLTALRTGAAGGVAAKVLARKNAKTAAFLGCGRQSLLQAQALVIVRPRLENFVLYDPLPENMLRFKKLAQKFFKGKFVLADSPESCVRSADILTTTTPSRQPIVKGAWLNPGLHINAIGADAAGKQELEWSALKQARIFVDDIAQAQHSGEINVPVARKQLRLRDVVGSLGDVLVRAKLGRRTDREITLFDSTGLAVQDLAAAALLYTQVCKR